MNPKPELDGAGVDNVIPFPGSVGASAEPTPFALVGALPSGTTVLEASAGTGKTYAITALAVR